MPKPRPSAAKRTGRTRRKPAAAPKRETFRVPLAQKDPYMESKKVARVADFSGVGDYKPFMAGDYELELQSYEWKTPKEAKESNINPATPGKAYDYASLKWVVRDETDVNGESVAGKVVFDTISENPKSLFMTKRVAIAAGEDPAYFEAQVDDTGKPLPLKIDLDEIYGNMVGRSVIGTVVVENFTKADGTVRSSNKVAAYAAVEQDTAALSARR